MPVDAVGDHYKPGADARAAGLRETPLGYSGGTYVVHIRYDHRHVDKVPPTSFNI